MLHNVKGKQHLLNVCNKAYTVVTMDSHGQGQHEFIARDASFLQGDNKYQEAQLRPLLTKLI